MSEMENETLSSVMPEFQPAPPTDDDKALTAIWEKHNGAAAELKNPAMPHVPAGEDVFKASWDWNQLPLKDRQMTAAVHRDFADLKKQGEALGMKTETAADMAAVQSMLAGKDDKAPPPAIDKDTQASLDTMREAFPDAKDNREAATFFKGVVDHIKRDPVEGTLSLFKGLPLTPIQRHQVYERIFGEAMQAPQQQQQPAEDSRAAVWAAWAAKHGVPDEDLMEMVNIVLKPVRDESQWSWLDRAYKELQRRGRPSAEGRINRAMDADMRALAADIYRE